MRGSWLCGGRYLNAKTVSQDTQRRGWVRDEPGYIRMLCLSRSLAMLSKGFPRDFQEIQEIQDILIGDQLFSFSHLGRIGSDGVARILYRDTRIGGAMRSWLDNCAAVWPDNKQADI